MAEGLWNEALQGVSEGVSSCVSIPPRTALNLKMSLKTGGGISSTWKKALQYGRKVLTWFGISLKCHVNTVFYICMSGVSHDRFTDKLKWSIMSYQREKYTIKNTIT